MIAYIKGDITFKSPTFVYVEAGGIGYRINITLNTYGKIEGMDKVKLLTHFHVKEDSQTLYGFFEEAERSLFIHLISVSGIGPTTAQVMLSSMTPEETRAAIISENVMAFKKVRGVGPKTAKRLILDLKDKMIKESGDADFTIEPIANNTIRQEALSALLSLQVNKIQAQKVLNKILKEQPSVNSVEEMVRLALKEL
ncbi:MAG: Holliday junction branch migration protein RuvA [Bacteroidetes bacterium]|jgi:Holliday junction DNA helicase RuvA|nr:Holliday junction branch migration protein RuvA [Bacteroidota bacterium]MDF1866553.1 Holliday junction branch migration protein RuvA [Saprospiraceae bacterium]